MQNSNIHTIKDVASRVGVTAKTIKRWYLAGKIPQPSRDRNRRPVFTDAMLRAILQFAFKITPPPADRGVRVRSGRVA